MPGPGQIFRDPKDSAILFFVREEDRDGTPGHLFASVEKRTVVTRWIPLDKVIPYTVINDTAGRAEAQVFIQELKEKEWSLNALSDVMHYVRKQWLSESQEDEVDMMYERRMKHYERANK